MTFNSRTISLKNKNDIRLYFIGKFLLYIILFFFVISLAQKIIFPSKSFTYSFNHRNSLKNNLNDFNISDNEILSFYVSTLQKFSNIDFVLEFKETPTFSGKVNVQKSYKAFFYPEGKPIRNWSEVKENFLVSQGESVYLISGDKKYPINNPETFVAMGFNWKAIRSGKNMDLSKYEKQKLLTIKSVHPDGTIFLTNKNHYFYIENGKKRLLDFPLTELQQKIHYPILVNEKSLSESNSCQMQKSFFNSKKYHCRLSLKEINSLPGSQYRFEVENFPTENSAQMLNATFNKTVSKENLKLFLSDFVKKVFNRLQISNIKT